MRWIAGFVALTLVVACDDETSDEAAVSDAAITDAASLDDGAVAAPDMALDSTVVATDGGPPVDAGSQHDAEAPAFPERCAAGEKQTVTVPTSDALDLVGDWYPGDRSGRAAVLLHMIPPGNDRTNYPPGFIEALTDRGIAVLNLDRRGAGDSPGRAVDAYEGPSGALDAEAALAFVRQTGCVSDARVAWIGASNGTTTVLDYTLKSAADPSLPAPAAVVYLTGGQYTENQHAIRDNRPYLNAISTLFVFSQAERAWSATFEFGAPDTWRFLEYDPGAHGTRMFGVRPEAVGAVADFVDSAL